MPNKNKPPVAIEYKFLATSSLPQAFDKSMSFFKRYMRQGDLLEGIHYLRAPGSHTLLWNQTLIIDWFACGGNTSAHKKAIERYLASLPSNVS